MHTHAYTYTQTLLPSPQLYVVHNIAGSPPYAGHMTDASSSLLRTHISCSSRQCDPRPCAPVYIHMCVFFLFVYLRFLVNVGMHARVYVSKHELE